jgi:hypothetical protein
LTGFRSRPYFANKVDRSKYNHFAVHILPAWAKEIVMRMLVILAALAFSAALVGCRAGVEVDDQASIAMPR